MRKPDSWGYAPFCKINITEDFINNMLPPFECYAWLVSEETVKDDDAMFSHLIVGWFGTITPLMPIETVLSTNLSLLDWAGNAEDFNL